MDPSESPPSASKSPKIGVMVATPVRHWKGMDQFHPAYQATVLGLQKLSNDPECPYEFQLCFQAYGKVRARNEIVSGFRRMRKANPRLRWLIWWDDDIEAAPADFLRVLSHKRPIVGGMYCRRKEPPIWVANFAHDMKLDGDGLLQVVELGIGGLKCYHHEVWEILQRFYPTLKYFDRDTGAECWGFFQETVMNEDAPSEDYFLDWLCRQAAGHVPGLAIWADTKLRLRHRDPEGNLFPSEWPPIPGLD